MACAGNLHSELLAFHFVLEFILRTVVTTTAAWTTPNSMFYQILKKPPNHITAKKTLTDIPAQKLAYTREEPMYTYTHDLEEDT